MTGSSVGYVIIATACLLLLLLVAFVAWIIRQRKIQQKLHNSREFSSHIMVRSPSFKIPVTVRAVDAQTPIAERLAAKELKVNKQIGRRAGVVHLQNEDSVFNYRDPRPEFPSSRRNALVPRGSLCTINELERPPEKVSATKGRQRKISAQVFEVLKTEGRKVSQSSVSEDIQHDAWVPALQAAKSNAFTSRQPVFSGSCFTSDEEEQTKSEPPMRGVRRRVANRRFDKKRKIIKSGKISFSTLYTIERKTLEIQILRAFELGKRKEHNFINPFVRLYLLPGRKQKQETRTQSKTKAPIFNHKMVFRGLSESDLDSHRLKLKVYSREAIRKHELLGETEIRLGSFQAGVTETFSLDLHLSLSEQNGKILISLSHNAIQHQLQVTAHEAKDLPRVGGIGLPDTYCRIIMCRESQWEKKETKIRRNTRNPAWQETHMLDVVTSGSDPLSIMSLIITVVSHSLMGKDEIMGHVIFGLDSLESEAVSHWRELEEAPHTRITRWHRLINPEEIEYYNLSL